MVNIEVVVNMIIVDELVYHNHKNPRMRGEWCHMCSTEGADAAELHEMAVKIGMKRSWFQGDHYDLRKSRRELAIQYGAIPLWSRQMIKVLRWRSFYKDKWDCITVEDLVAQNQQNGTIP